jgi:hypothetical protein
MIGRRPRRGRRRRRQRRQRPRPLSQAPSNEENAPAPSPPQPDAVANGKISPTAKTSSGPSRESRASIRGGSANPSMQSVPTSGACMGPRPAPRSQAARGAARSPYPGRPRPPKIVLDRAARHPQRTPDLPRAYAGGHVLNPLAPSVSPIPNATVIGARTILKF